ncbi:PilW family protein [Parashewanella tropica]|uniref:PilW family protein n=1 Tax=Parashewanella tropica TaxID=2547970 RepID=UPI00105A4ECC|nr:PilW family protein [Parashewanella tropica]
MITRSFFIHKNNLSQGFSLVELMVSMVISLFLTLGLFTMFRMSSTNVTTTSQFNDLQENGRMALALMERDLSQTAFMGDMTGERLMLKANTQVLATSLGQASDCIGGGLNNESLPIDSPSPFRLVWGYKNGISTEPFSCLKDVAPNTDVLQIKRVRGPSSDTRLTTKNQYYVATNINEAIFYKGDEVDAADLIKLQDPTLRFWSFAHHIYYVKKKNGIPSLHRRRLVGFNMNGGGGGDQQLVEGIENIRILYGIDRNFDNDVDLFLPAANVTDEIWSGTGDDRIIALQVFLMVRSIDKDPSYTNNVGYDWGDPGSKLKFDDHYRRKIVMTTISLDNLMASRNSE